MTDVTEIDLIYALVAAPDGKIFAARKTGLYISEDEGATWRDALVSLRLESPLAVTALALAPDSTLFAGIAGGVMTSLNAGQTWEGVLLPAPPPTISALSVSPNFVNDGLIIAGTLDDGIYRSTDRGKTWSAGNFGLLDYRVLAVAILPDQSLIIGTETGLFRSVNGGRSWQDVDFPYVFVLSVTRAPDGSVYAGTEAHGLYISQDGGITWASVALPFDDVPINQILVSKTHLHVLAGDEMWSSQDNGLSWKAIETNVIAVAFLNDKHLTLGLSDGTVLVVSI